MLKISYNNRSLLVHTNQSDLGSLSDQVGGKVTYTYYSRYDKDGTDNLHDHYIDLDEIDLVGTVVFTVDSRINSPIRVEMLSVDKDYRRLGIGTSMIKDAMRHYSNRSLYGLAANTDAALFWSTLSDTEIPTDDESLVNWITTDGFFTILNGGWLIMKKVVVYI